MIIVYKVAKYHQKPGTNKTVPVGVGVVLRLGFRNPTWLKKIPRKKRNFPKLTMIHKSDMMFMEQVNRWRGKPVNQK